MQDHETISIVAGGWSARHHDVLHLPGFVVGVNDSALFARCDAAVSMDRLWVENRWSRLVALHIPTWIRRAALTNIKDRPDWVNKFECNHESAEMSDDPEILNGTNSGLCAVNLAFQLRPERLYLYGMDLSVGPNGERHWYPDYEFKPAGKGTSGGTFTKWKRDLNQALSQCRKVGIGIEVMT